MTSDISENTGHYKCLPRQLIQVGDYSVRPVCADHIEEIRIWRNSQLDVLRQMKPITPDEQRTYYAREIWPDQLVDEPRNILIAFYKGSTFIGYGGLVHINWDHSRAEMSYLLNPSVERSESEHHTLFLTYIELIKTLAFQDLRLAKVSTETFEFRRQHILALEEAGFEREGRLRNHVVVNGNTFDSIVHSCLPGANSMADLAAHANTPIEIDALNGKRVFVSGGAGVIGLELIPQMVAAGATLLVGDLKPRPHTFPKSVQYRQGDLNTLSQEEWDSFDPEIFIHLAATFERSTESATFWEENFLHNVRLSHHLMSLAKEAEGLARVVFASSYLIYDQDLYQFDVSQEEPVFLKEQDPIQPRNLTGMAKLSHEMELRFLDGLEKTSFSMVCARIYRGYGCNSRDIISRWVRALLAGEEITLYRPEGLFDYIFAGDSAEGLARLAAAEQVTGVINLGTGKSRRVGDIVEALKTHFPDIRIHTGDSDIAYEASCADVNLLRQKIGWVPSISLEEGIKRIVTHESRTMAQPATNDPELGAILLTSAARKIPLLKALKHAAVKLRPEAEIIAGDSDPNALSKFFADDFWQMPRLDGFDAASLVDALKERRITHILPTRDGELLFWAAHRASLSEHGITVFVSDEAAIDHCLDKLKFAGSSASHSHSIIPASDDINALAASEFYVVKERFGAGSQSLGLKLDKDAATAHAQKLENPIFQPFIEGPEVSIDAWLDTNSRVKGLIIRRRDLVINGESQVTTTLADTELEIAARDAIETLGLRGHVVMQAIIGENRNLHIIECNPRFGGASTASLAAGLDSLYWSLAESLGAEADDLPFHRHKGNIRQVRAAKDMILHDIDL